MAVEKVQNYGFVSIYVFVPCLKTGLIVFFAFRFGLGDVRLLLVLVEIFRHEIKNGVYALL